jgi:phosphotriesterase-related protein
MLDQTRAEILHALVERGHVERLLISHDRNRGHEMRFGGGSGYNHIFETFLPRLRKLGVSEEEISTIMVRNPAQAFNRG